MNVELNPGDRGDDREHDHGVGYDSPFDTFPLRRTGLNNAAIHRKNSMTGSPRTNQADTVSTGIGENAIDAPYRIGLMN